MILTGLFDEITQQRVVTEEIQSDLRDAQTSLKRISIDFQNATAKLARQKKGNVLLIFLNLIGFTSNLLIWIVGL